MGANGFGGKWIGALSAPLLGLVLSGSAIADEPYDAIASGQMTEMIDAIITRYEDAGLSWNDAIAWDIGPFTTSYWYYDQYDYRIVVGAVPLPGEVAAYWQNWSQVLTDGQFDPDTFFASDEEALELARFNQFILATHESAHAITYRYDGEHIARHDYEVNCREYYADRLTVAILDDAARADPRISAWRDRYFELITAMGNTIPEQYRFHISGFKALDKNCALIHVAQPSPDSMQAYASAYFERQRALLSVHLPTFDALAARLLFARQAERFAQLPPVPERAELQVETLDRIAKLDIGSSFNDVPDGFSADQAAGFAPDGSLYFVRVTRARDSDNLQVELGRPGGPNAPLVEDFAWPRHDAFPELSSMAIAGPDLIYLTFDEYPGRSSLFALENKGSSWELRQMAKYPDFGSARVMRKSDGSFLLALSDASESMAGGPGKGWRVIPFTSQVSPDSAFEDIGVEIDDPIGADLQNRLYFDHMRTVLRIASAREIQTYLGTFLDGNLDGPASMAQIDRVLEMQPMADGSILLLDRDVADRGTYLVRRVTPLDP